MSQRAAGPYSGAEKRRYPRPEVTGATVRYHRRGLLARLFGGKEPAEAVPIRNISRRGICFYCNRPLKRGEALELDMKLRARGGEIAVGAEVVWRSRGKGRYSYQVGARFSSVGPEADKVLSEAK